MELSSANDSLKQHQRAIPDKKSHHKSGYIRRVPFHIRKHEDECGDDGRYRHEEGKTERSLATDTEKQCDPDREPASRYSRQNRERLSKCHAYHNRPGKRLVPVANRRQTDNESGNAEPSSEQTHIITHESNEREQQKRARGRDDRYDDDIHDHLSILASRGIAQRTHEPQQIVPEINDDDDERGHMQEYVVRKGVLDPKKMLCNG